MPTPPRLISFDAAGTLFVPHPSVGAVYAEVAAACGLDRDPADLEARFRPAFAATVARWPVPYGRDDEDARRFWAEVVEATFGEPLPYELVCQCYDTFARARRWRVLPGVREALALIAARRLPAVVVSNFDARLPALLADAGLGPFVAVVTSAQTGAAKPAPAALLEACRRVGIAAVDTLHLGDSAREDGGMCAAAGARWLEIDPRAGIPLATLGAMLDGR
jgi:REG-2-like HAD superfamily hydrolase